MDDIQFEEEHKRLLESRQEIADARTSPAETGGQGCRYGEQDTYRLFDFMSLAGLLLFLAVR